MPPTDTPLNCTMDDYKKIYMEKQYSDMLFAVGPMREQILAHIALVAARSNYLGTKILEAQTMPKVLDEEERLLEVHLPNVKPEAFGLILEYIYTDDTFIGKQFDDKIILLTDVYQLAELYLIKSLKDLCLKLIRTSITELNVLEALVYAFDNGIPVVKDICLKVLNKNSKILNHVVMSEEFCNLDKSLLLEIMRNKLNSGHTLSYSSTDAANPVKDRYSTFAEDMNSFLLSDGKDFSDVDLVLMGQTIKAHKSILNARTQYFRGMFRHSMPPDNKVHIIDDKLPSVEVFQSLLSYIYTGNFVLSARNALYLLEAGDFYGFSNNHFYVSCRQALEMIGDKDALEVLKASDFTQNLEIKKQTLQVIKNNFAHYVRQPKFCSLSRELLLEIISVVHGIKFIP